MDEFSRLRTGWAFIISLAAFTAVLAALALPGMVKGRVLEAGWESYEDGAWKPLKLPLVKLVRTREPGTVIVRTRVEAKPGDVLYVPRPRAQYLLVTWRGREILEASTPASMSGNLWNRIHSIELEGPGSGELVITISADRTIGLPRAPFISDKASVKARIGMANFIARELFYVGIGTLVSLGLLLVVRAVRRREGLSAGALIGIACLTGIVYLMDFTYFEDLGSRTALFWEKKIALSSGYACALCYALGAEKFLTGGIRRAKYLAIPTALAILVMIGSWTQFIFWNAVNVLNLILLCDMAFLVFILLREDRRGLGLHLPGFFLAFSIIQLLSVFIFNLSLPLVIQYAVILNGIFLGVVTALNPAEPELREGQPASGASVRDSLTGLPDRFWLDRVHMRGPGSVAAIGVKGYHATVAKLGQSAGDKAVLTLADVLKEQLRRSDVAIRMDSDLFVVMMEAVEEEGALRAMARVSDEFSRKETNAGLRLCYSIGSMGSNAADSAEEAMRRLELSDERQRAQAAAHPAG